MEYLRTMLFPISVIHYCACACFNKEGRISLVLLIYCSLQANCYTCTFVTKTWFSKCHGYTNMYIVHVCTLSSKLKLIHNLLLST